jgi:Tat protein translocase TatB subunit
MEFLGVGLPELLVILLITLIFVGPKRLPEMAAQIARAMREFRRYSSNINREVTGVLEDLEKEYRSVRQEWKEVGEAVREDVKAIEAEVTGAAADARSGLAADRPAGEQAAPQGQSTKVVSMEDAAGRRAQTDIPPDTGRDPSVPPEPPSTEARNSDHRPAEQGRS